MTICHHIFFARSFYGGYHAEIVKKIYMSNTKDKPSEINEQTDKRASKIIRKDFQRTIKVQRNFSHQFSSTVWLMFILFPWRQ